MTLQSLCNAMTELKTYIVKKPYFIIQHRQYITKHD